MPSTLWIFLLFFHIVVRVVQIQIELFDFCMCYWLLQLAIYYASNTVDSLNNVVYVVLVQLLQSFTYYLLLHIAICYASNTMDIFLDIAVYVAVI